MRQWTVLALVLSCATVLLLPADAGLPSPVECLKMGGFVCRNSSYCLQPSVACDGTWDCTDGSDEDPAFCATYTCAAEGYKRVKCPNNKLQCISQSVFCDGKQDCPDGADEDVTHCAKFNCEQTNTVKCPSGVGCIAQASMCDGQQDCADGSDEAPALCKKYDCTLGQTVKCPGGNSCMQSPSNLCDGISDCADGSDESRKICNPTFNCTNNMAIRCPSGYGCVNDRSNLCDGMQDCLDGSDEDPKFCSAFDCKVDGRVKCPSGVGCLGGMDKICSGTQYCMDNSDNDPKLCNANYNCKATGRVLCPSKKMCASSASFCQTGSAVCSDGSDQAAAFCAAYQCPAGYTKCKTGNLCLNDEAFCDGTKNCPDGSDESPATCTNFNCAATNRYLCPSGSYCMANDCDICQLIGYNHSFCPDKSDQMPKYCNKQPSPQVCSARCDPRTGPCAPPHKNGQISALTPAPMSTPTATNPSKQHLDAATYKLNTKIQAFRNMYATAISKGYATGEVWKSAALAAQAAQQKLGDGASAITSGELVSSLRSLLQAAEGIPGIHPGTGNLGKASKKTIKSLLKSASAVLSLLK